MGYSWGQLGCCGSDLHEITDGSCSGVLFIIAQDVRPAPWSVRTIDSLFYSSKLGYGILNTRVRIMDDPPDVDSTLTEF